MAKVQCAISNLSFTCSHLPIDIPVSRGYFHPIFALHQSQLLPLYSKHCQGQLTNTDSYLLFLAYLHSTEQVTWYTPANCLPNELATIQLVENNLSKLVNVIELTNCIKVSSFHQPNYSINTENNTLKQIPNWIAAWDRNIQDLKDGYVQLRILASINKVESRLTDAILSGKEPKQYAGTIAAWAAKAADFPPAKSDEWQKVIRTCFNSEKMFSTPLAIIKEIKAYCEENLEVGSIHFHTLHQTLLEGIARHKNFLGLTYAATEYSFLAIDSSDITVTDTSQVAYDMDKPRALEVTTAITTLVSIVDNAPKAPPVRNAYDSDIDFLRAKLRYSVAMRKLSSPRTVSAAAPDFKVKLEIAKINKITKETKDG